LALVLACLGIFSHFAITNLLSKAEAGLLRWCWVKLYGWMQGQRIGKRHCLLFILRVLV
jgi:hypothetical protein